MITKLLKKGSMLFSLTFLLALSPSAYAQYCTPGATNQARYIINFSTTGGTENVSNLTSGFSAGGYGDFTAMTVSQIQANTVQFSTDFAGGTAGFRIWVDWNHDEIFDTTTEVAYQSTAYGNSQSGSITVPDTALEGETRMRVVSHWLSATGSVDPCATGFTYGEFEDYTFNVGALDVCSGAEAGTVVGDTDRVVCGNTAFTLAVEGNSPPASGLTRTWQSSPAGANTWTDLNVSSSTLTVAGIDVATDYRYHVECDNGDSDNSEVISATINPNPEDCYCTPEGTNSARFINNFSTTGGIQNISNLASGFSPLGYGDFTAMTLEVAPAAEISFTADVEGGTAGFRAWIDWNKDGSFDTTEEVVYQSTGYLNTHTGTITVPADATSLTTRMRIVSSFIGSTGDVNPCATAYTYGEFEDYTFTVTVDCDGTPDAGVATVDPDAGLPNTAYTVSATGFTDGTGLTYQWQSNTDAAGFVNEGTATDAYVPFMATAPADAGSVVEWRLAVTCTVSTEISYSEIATFTTTADSSYCMPVLDCTDGDNITNVTFQEINNTTDCSPAGYGDFTAMAAVVQSGGTFPISVTVGAGFANESVSVWIDFDNSGTFDEAEFFFIGTGSGSVVSGDIVIPAGTAFADYRMRVRVAAVGGVSATFDLACDEAQVFGETEDYTVTVNDVAGVNDFSNLKVSYYPNPMTDVLNISAKQPIKSVTAYNVLGQQVLSTTQIANGKVDVSTLSTGTFIFRVTFEGGFEEHFKVLKK